jgi:hypothetical protein
VQCGPGATLHPPPDVCRVKQYEGKLAALNAINSALQNENGQLRKQLARAELPENDAGECTQRLGCRI